MDDVLYCPICGNKLRTSHHNAKLLHVIGKTADYAERTCSAGYNHIVVLWCDKATGKIDFLKFTLNHTYSRFLEIDYISNKSRVTCRTGENKHEYIDIPKIIVPDFPDLKELKEKINLYIVFS